MEIEFRVESVGVRGWWSTRPANLPPLVPRARTSASGAAARYTRRRRRRPRRRDAHRFEGAPPLPRTFHWRHWSLGAPFPPRQDSTTPGISRVIAPRLSRSRCSLFPDEFRTIDGGFLGRWDDWMIALFAVSFDLSYRLVILRTIKFGVSQEWRDDEWRRV